MYCPCCGKQTPESQRFCRSCGLDLQAVSEAVLAHLSATEADTAEKADPTSRERKLNRWGIITGLSGIMIFLLLVVSFLFASALSRVLGTSTNAFEFIAPWAVGTAFLLTVTGLGLVSYPHLVKALAKPQRAQPAVQPQAEVVQLPSAREVDPMPSVTEHTTHALEPLLAPDRRVTKHYERPGDEE
jgi:hypothetical protein